MPRHGAQTGHPNSFSPSDKAAAVKIANQATKGFREAAQDKKNSSPMPKDLERIGGARR
jgi:hypothetical protein